MIEVSRTQQFKRTRAKHTYINKIRFSTNSTQPNRLFYNNFKQFCIANKY